MAAKRHRLAQRRKNLGFTQEGLAERLEVDPTTVRRWESGETGPKPWLRPKLARSLQVSAAQLEELLGEDAETLGVSESSPASVQPRLDGHSQIFIPVIVNGRPVLVPLDRDTEDDDTMSPLNRRSVISYGLAAAAKATLSSSDAIQALQQGIAPPALGLTSGVPWAVAIYQAVLNPAEAARQVAAAAADGLDRRELRRQVDRAMQVSLTSDYAALAGSLPGLIGQAEAAAMQAGHDERIAGQALSDVYAVVGWTLIKADIPLGAWLAAQRAVQAAEAADDVLRVAAATRCLAEVHMRAGNFEEATRTAFLAAVHLERATLEDRPRSFSLRGAALLSAAAASARRGDRREAQAALQAAEVCAGELGQDRSDLATVFGPTNVAIHQVAIPIELGDAREAVRHIPGVQLERLPKVLTERRSRFLIDVARSYAQVGDDGAAIGALIDAEKIAPDELRHHRLTRQLVPQLLTREHRSSDLRGLAERCNLLA